MKYKDTKLLQEAYNKVILKEGGNVFKIGELTQRINRADVDPTIKFLESITGLPLIQNKLGSTGVTVTSGDIDLAVDENINSKEDLISKLTDWAVNNNVDPKEYIKKTGINVHFKAPIKGNAANGYVQADFMFTDNFDWLKWAYGPILSSKYKGVFRLVLLSSIAKPQGYKLSPTNGLIDRNTNQLVSTDPNEIAKIIIGDRATIRDLSSVEAIIKSIENRPDFEELVADAREAFNKYGTPLEA